MLLLKSIAMAAGVLASIVGLVAFLVYLHGIFPLTIPIMCTLIVWGGLTALIYTAPTNVKGQENK